MARRITIVVSQGQSASPEKRNLEEEIVAGLLMDPTVLTDQTVEVTVISHLYDLSSQSTGLLCLQGIAGDMIVLSWLYPRAAHWTLARHGIRGRFGVTLLKTSEETDAEGEGTDSSEEDSSDSADEPGGSRRGVLLTEPPNRTIYHVNFRAASRPEPFWEEIRRIVRESAVETVNLALPGGMPGGAAAAPAASGEISLAAMNGHDAAVAVPSHNGHAHSAQEPSSAAVWGESIVPPGGPIRIAETPTRRWYPVIDYSRCTNCMECIDFCLFGVYGVDRAETIAVEQPDNCRKGCPACSRICPENAIIFPQHKSPEIAGGITPEGGGLKIDLSQLFGGSAAADIAAQERDQELVAAGREAVGATAPLARRESSRPAPKDELDSLIDQLDDLAL